VDQRSETVEGKTEEKITMIKRKKKKQTKNRCILCLRSTGDAVVYFVLPLNSSWSIYFDREVRAFLSQSHFATINER
jgi:hypothetical protein